MSYGAWSVQIAVLNEDVVRSYCEDELEEFERYCEEHDIYLPALARAVDFDDLDEVSHLLDDDDEEEYTHYGVAKAMVEEIVEIFKTATGVDIALHCADKNEGGSVYDEIDDNEINWILIEPYTVKPEVAALGDVFEVKGYVVHG